MENGIQEVRKSMGCIHREIFKSLIVPISMLAAAARLLAYNGLGMRFF